MDGCIVSSSSEDLHGKETRIPHQSDLLASITLAPRAANRYGLRRLMANLIMITMIKHKQPQTLTPRIHAYILVYMHMYICANIYSTLSLPWDLPRVFLVEPGAIMARPRPSCARPCQPPLRPHVPGLKGIPWDPHGPGPCGPGPSRPPWVLMGRALVCPPGHCRPGTCGVSSRPLHDIHIHVHIQKIQYIYVLCFSDDLQK